MKRSAFALSALAALLIPGAALAAGDPLGRHHSAAAQITSANVHRLAPAWTFHTGDVEALPAAELKKSAAQATPLLLPDAAGAALVVCTPLSRVIALDPGTGKVRWQYDPQVRRGGWRGTRCRGVAYASAGAGDAHCAHRVIAATHDRRVVALDARDGKPCDGFGQAGIVALPDHASERPGDISSSSAPAVANGVIVVGSAIIDFEKTQAPRGTVHALDAVTGAPRWQFDPLAGIADYGAANVWAPISIDADRDLVFLATSSPSPDYVGTLRKSDGDANAVVALRLSSGAKVWSFATTHHDLWDYDLPAQPILFDWPAADGRKVPALAQLTKQGFVFVLDRRDGTPLFEVREQPVAASTLPGERASPTQPVPVKPPPLMNTRLAPDDAWGLTFWDRGRCRDAIAALENHGLFTQPSEKPFRMLPASLGGPIWGGGALLPGEHLRIVNVNPAAFTGQLLRTDALPPRSEGDHVTAGSAFLAPIGGTPWTMKIDVLKSPLGMPCVAPPWGKLVAVDLARGEIRWQAPLGSIHEMGPVPLPFQVDWGTPNLGGGLVTDGGVFFIGATMDRQFRAFDARSGKMLWRHTLPADATATPMTYMHQGRQYVVVNAGGHSMYNRRMGDGFHAFALP